MKRTEPTIDGYEIEGPIGQGGMCSVYSAINVQSSQRVAIKVLLPQLAEQHEQRERFMREGLNMANLHHSNVVRVLEVGQCNVGPYIAMEFIDGKTLRQLMDEKLPLSQLLTIGADIARVLEFAHKAGYLHRDLKPSNIIVADTGLTKVADWGLSKSMEDPSGLTKTGIVVGTPGYMSPEQILGKELEGTSDLYALGIILYEALANTHPFDYLSVTEVLGAQLTKEPKPLSKVNPALPRPLTNLVHSLLQKKEEERENSAVTVAEKLEALRESDVYPQGLKNETLILSHTIEKHEHTRRRKTNNRYLPLFAFLVFFTIVALASSSRQSVKTKPPVFKKTDLKNLHELSIRYDVFERTKAIFTIDGYQTTSFELLPAPSKHGRLRTLSIPLKPAATKAFRLSIMAAEHKWTFDYDTKGLIDDLLAPVDKVGENISNLAKKLDFLRLELEGVRRGKGKNPLKDFRKTYKELLLKLHHTLSSAGLDNDRLSPLDAYTKSALPNNVLPGTPLARRFLPLRQIERALSEHMGLKPPWEPIYRLLGFEYVEGFCKPATSDMSRIVHLNLVRQKGNRSLWYWMGEKDFVNSMRQSSILEMTTMPNVKEQLVSRQNQWNEGKDYFPSANEIEWELTRSFLLDDKDNITWPPRRAKMSIVIKLFARHNEILIRLNGRGPISLLNVALMDWWGHTGRSSLSTLTASFPFDPSWLKLGNNKIHVEPMTVPGEEYIAPCALTDIIIDCSFDEATSHGN